MQIDAKVELLTKAVVPKRKSTFQNLEIGEGVVSRTGTRVKVSGRDYFHFTLQSKVDTVQGKYWPEEAIKCDIKNFVLIAKEVE